MDWGALIPRLQRFYGGKPQDWLEAIPAGLVRAYVRMMPRIEAGETLSAINRAALTNNVGFESDLDRHHAIDLLEHKARGILPGDEPARTASGDDLAGMGIGIVMEEAPSSSAAVGEQETPSSSAAVGEQDAPLVTEAVEGQAHG